MTDSGRARLASAASRAARLGFVAVVLLSPLRAGIDLVQRPDPPVYAAFTDLIVSWSDIAVALTLACWVVAVVARRRPIAAIPRFVAWPVVGLLAVAAAGVPVSVDPVLAANGVVRLAALAALAAYVVDDVGRSRLVVPAVAAMIVVESIVAIGQYLAQASLGLGVLGEHLLDPTRGVSVVTTAAGDRILRAYGLADHPNILGGILAVGLVIVVGALAARRTRPTRVAVAAWIVVGLGGAALFATFSRGAWLGAGAGLVVLGAMRAARLGRRAVRPVVAACAAGLVAVTPLAVGAGPALAARSDLGPPIATEVRSLDERAGIAEATNAIFIAHPILGVGVGALPSAIRAADPTLPWDYQPASVVILDVAAETGLAGAVLFLLILVGPWLALVRRRHAWSQRLAVASAALAVIDILGLVDYYTWTYPSGRIWWWLILGLWVAAYQSSAAAAWTDDDAH